MTTQTAAVSAAAATYTKLKNGTWGVRAAAGVTVGQAITVSKRDGTSKTEVVAGILWTGTARDGRQASLVTIAPTQRSSCSSTRSSRAPRTGCSCGSREDSPADSDCRSCRFENFDQ